MLMEELCSYPIEITMKYRMIGYWLCLITGKQTKLANCLHHTMLNIPNFESKLITSIKNILSET